MNQCKQCGATLPEDSSVCLQCGAKNAKPKGDSDDTPRKELDFLKPALAGGAVLGVLSSLPYIQYVNIACCLWVLAGGGLAAFLLDKQRPGTLTYGDGAIGGVFAGLFGTIVGAIVGIPVRLIQMTPERFAQVQSAVDRMPPGAPQWIKDIMLESARPGINVTLILIGLVIGLVVNSIFASAGGALTVAILNRKKTD